MTLFVLDNVDELTSRYHTEGGLVVVASDLDAAKALVAATCTEAKITDDEWAAAVQYHVDDAEPRVFVFPDAGCC